MNCLSSSDMKPALPRLLAAFSLALAAVLAPAASAQELDRTVLPITEPEHPPITTLDARDAKVPLAA